MSFLQKPVTELWRRKTKRLVFIAKPMDRRMGLFDFLEKWFCFSMIDDLSGVRLATVMISGLTISSREKLSVLM